MIPFSVSMEENLSLPCPSYRVMLDTSLGENAPTVRQGDGAVATTEDFRSRASSLS